MPTDSLKLKLGNLAIKCYSSANMFTEDFMKISRNDVLEFAKNDDRVTGVAITGSVTMGKKIDGLGCRSCFWLS